MAKAVSNDFTEFFGDDKITTNKHFKFTELEKKLYKKLTKDFEDFISKIEKKFDEKLSITMTSSDDSDLSMEIKFEGPEKTVDKGEKMFIDKLDAFRAKIQDEEEVKREYDILDKTEIIQKREKLEKEISKIQKGNKKDKIKFPDTWTWDNMSKEGMQDAVLFLTIFELLLTLNYCFKQIQNNWFLIWVL